MTSRVDPEGARRMMEMLVNLYADRRLAVAREYVSNAVDATRAAGRAEPVAVTTPTLIEPNLIVTDRGTGMSLAEVEATFLAFAASSKRDSNEMIGGLGVGAKSAWTLAESFLVDTVKGGLRTTVRAARNLEHQVLLAGVPSDLPDGTTIIVPVEVAGHVEAWHRVVREVACAHDAGAVLVDGEPVDSLAGGPTWIGPVSCRRVDRPDHSAVMVRSGGTLFASVPEVTKRVTQATRLPACVLELPIGSFDHTPSRESVIATERTLAAVDAALAQFRVAYDALAQKISRLAATDVAAAVKLRSDTLGGMGTAATLPIPFRVGVPIGVGAWHVSTLSGRSRWKRIENSSDDVFEAVTARAEMSTTLVVTGVPAGRVLSRFATFLAEKHPTIRRLIAVPESATSVALNVFAPGNRLTDQTWPLGADTDGIAVRYTFEQWNAAMAGRRVTRGPSMGYGCQIIDRYGGARRNAVLSGPEIAALGLPVIYTDDATYQVQSGQPASVTVYLGRRKSGPLLAAVPEAMTRGAWMQRRFTAETAGWSPEELLAVCYVAHRQRASVYAAAFGVAAAALAASPENHPRRALLSRIAALVQAAGKVTEAQASLVGELRECAAAQTQFGKVRELYADLRQAYPLLYHLRGWDNSEPRGHYVEYVAHTPPQAARKAS
ncbi:ATP-binding protein [Mycolicibacterium wolinskyi]|uniref:Histidine kinase n=1 Tax=Mycolicibacterium wolinskyi TaxID=59750 RepID=A0A1X2FKT6_9MYCO|nr:MULTISPECIES: ATP-binding protein [Mycolicibacterium]MCV7286144.1 ATP-binding protein [Mycolicibacterium wolinskyi]MCV7296340.1 ATP-binding protein [Mycolicibacterium goodii]ORX18589.1 histidine kinase [Mycolicibacterium wolinskyi]